jgi:hypothetical protein
MTFLPKMEIVHSWADDVDALDWSDGTFVVTVLSRQTTSDISIAAAAGWWEDGQGRLRDRSFDVGHCGVRLCRSVGARDEPRLPVQAPRCRRGPRRGHAPSSAQRDRSVPLEVVDDRLVAVAAFLAHVAALTLLPLSLAQAVLSGGFVLLAVLAERFLGFQLGRRQWVGIVLVAVSLEG